MSMTRHMDEVIDALGTGSRRIARALEGRSKRQRQEILDNIRRIRDKDGDLSQRSLPTDVPTPNGNQARQLADLEARGVLTRNADGSYRLREAQAPTDFTPNPDHNLSEVQRQLQMQQDGMNRLTVQEFLDNRDTYELEGRTDESLQSLYRSELKAAGYTMDGNAVLHGPDQVAGGHPYRVDGLGDSRVNSSIGAQWESRIDALQTAIQGAASAVPTDLHPHVQINVNLPLS